MLTAKTIVPLLTLLITAGPVTLTYADQQHQQDQQKPQIDRAKAIQRVKQNTQGRILKVHQKKDKFEVKVLRKSGRVISVDVDKKSGKITQPKKK